MPPMIEHLKTLSAAEEFLDYFGIAFEPSVVHVKRLHILKRFYQYLRQEAGLSRLDDAALFERYKELLARAYEDFVNSTAAQEKVFKVFQDAEGKSVSLDSLRQTLPSAPAHA